MYVTSNGVEWTWLANHTTSYTKEEEMLEKLHNEGFLVGDWTKWRAELVWKCKIHLDLGHLFTCRCVSCQYEYWWWSRCVNLVDEWMCMIHLIFHIFLFEFDAH